MDTWDNDANKKKHLLQFLRMIPVICKTVIMLSYLFGFALLVGVDAMKAFRKRAHWVPGNALVLSALTIQALAFVALGIVSTSDEPDKYQFVHLLHIQLLVDGGRLSMCIFVAYVLPRMVGSRSVKDLGLITALAISLFIQIMSELYYVYRAKDVSEIMEYIRKKRRRHWYLYWFKLSTYMLFVSMIFLVSAITCTFIAGRTVRRLLNQRITVIFSTANEIQISQVQHSNNEIQTSEAQDSKKRTWMDFEDEVFKAWVVTRVAQPDYVMARSVLNSAAGLVVTLCTLFSVMKTVWIIHNYGRYFNNYFHNVFTEYGRTWMWFEVCAVCSFFTVGWVVICWRWITAVFFFPKLRGRGRFFCVEDFWINSIIELKHVWEIKSLRLRTRSRSDTDFASLLIKIFAKMRLHNLLYALSKLQMSFVLICKVCHFLSEMVCMLLQFIIKRLLVRIRVPCNHGQQEASAKSAYSSRFEEFEDILERMCMPGEDPEFLWKANLSSINQVELFMDEGRKAVNNNEFVDSHSSEFDLQWIDQGFQLLSKLRSKSLPQGDKYFPDLTNPCWKLTAVSLLNVIIQLHGEKSAHIMPSIKACEEVWDMLSFADNANIEADRLNLIHSYDADAHQVSMAADQEFHRIQNFDVSSDSDADAQRGERQHRLGDQLTQAKAVLKAHRLLQDSGEENGCVDSGALHDSMDWMKIALHYSLYKLLTVMEDENSQDLITWAEFSLRNIIFACLSELPDILFQYAKQCAQEFNEDSLWNTVYIAGKTRAVWEAFGLDPIFKMPQMSNMERSVEGREQETRITEQGKEMKIVD